MILSTWPVLAHTLSEQIDHPARLSLGYITSEEQAAAVYKFVIVGCKEALGVNHLD